MAYAKNAFAAGAPPRTLLEELTALSRDPSWILGRRFAAGREIGGQERKGEKEEGREGRAGRGRAPETPYSR